MVENIKQGDTIEFYTCCNADRKLFTGKVEYKDQLGFISIVDGIQHATQHFPAFVQMVQISTGEVLAGVAITGGIQRRIIMAMERIADLDDTGVDKQMPIAGIAGWHHAVKHINTAAYRFYDIFRLTDTHQIARLVGWHFFRGVV